MINVYIALLRTMKKNISNVLVDMVLIWINIRNALLIVQIVVFLMDQMNFVQNVKVVIMLMM